MAPQATFVDTAYQSSCLVGIQCIGQMRGASQSKLLLADDGNLWVVKFINNPQHKRVLANEWIATHIASAIGLSAPEVRAIDVPVSLVNHGAGLFFRGANGSQIPCAAGLQFASRYVGGLLPGQVTDLLPSPYIERTRNLIEFAGALAFDKWMGNVDGRQAVFHKSSKQPEYTAAFIDQGHCFGAEDWAFRDSPQMGVYASNTVYRHITGWHDFEPWLGRIENFPKDKLSQIVLSTPHRWLDTGPGDLDDLIRCLLRRKEDVRNQILSFRESGRTPFPLWKRSCHQHSRLRTQMSYLYMTDAQHVSAQTVQ